MKLDIKLDAKMVGGLVLPDDKDEETFWDVELAGFGCRLRRRGGKLHQSWIAQCRTDAGRTTKKIWPETVPATEARTAARKFLASVALGNDPQGERKAKRRAEAQTFHAVASLYLAAYERERRPTSLRIARLYLTGPYFKPLHSAAINSITHADIAARVRAIENAHSAFTAGAARRAVSAFFAWAIAEGLRAPPNPVIGTRQPADPPARDRVLSIDELRAVWNVTGGDSDGDRVVRLLMLTAARASEIGGMMWGEFADDGTWTLPKERSKNHRSLTLQLSDEALAIVRSTPSRSGREHLFGRGRKGFASWRDLKRLLDERLGDMVKPWRLHDLRRSVATHMAEKLAVPPHIVEMILNHYSGHKRGVAGTYNRAVYARETTIALTRWADYLLAHAEGRDEDVVVPLLRV